MAKWHAERKRKLSGSIYKKKRDKRKCELGREPAHTLVSEKTKSKKVRTQGKNQKTRIMRAAEANVLDKSTNKFQKVKINKIMENSANRHFARMGVLTKGAIIETEIGKAKVISRPGQDGVINAVLVK